MSTEPRQNQDKQPFFSRIHVDPTIGFGHLLTTLGLAALFIASYMSIGERVAVLESRQVDTTTRIVTILENQRFIDARQDAALSETRQMIRDDVRDINIKLDNILRTVTGSREPQP